MTTHQEVLEQDAKTLEDITHISEDKLKTLSDLIHSYREAQREVERTDQAHDEALIKFNKLREHTIPDYMSNLGVSGIDLDNDTRIELKEITVANITQERKDKAHAWLIDHGFKDIIKNEFKINFGRDDSESANLFQNQLKGNDLLSKANWTQKETVHYQTLGAIVREQIEKGNDAFLEADAQELLGIKQFNHAVIK